MDVTQQNELRARMRSASMWGFVREYTNISKHPECVYFVQNRKHMKRLMYAFRNSEQMIPFCVALGNFEYVCPRPIERTTNDERFHPMQAPDENLIPIQTVLNSNIQYKKCWDFTFALGTGCTSWYVSSRNNKNPTQLVQKFIPKDISVVDWVNHLHGGFFYQNKVDRVRYKYKNKQPSSKKVLQKYRLVDGYDDLATTDYSTIFPTAFEFEFILNLGKPVESHKLVFGFILQKRDEWKNTTLVSKPLQFAVPSRFTSGSTQLFNVNRYICKKIAPLGHLGQCVNYLDEHPELPQIIALDNVESKYVEDLLPMFNDPQENYFVVFDRLRYAYEVREQVINTLHQLGIDRLSDGSLISQFYQVCLDFNHRLKNTFNNDEMFEDLFQSELFRFVAKPKKLVPFVFGIWNAKGTIDERLKCNQQFNLEFTDCATLEIVDLKQIHEIARYIINAPFRKLKSVPNDTPDTPSRTAVITNKTMIPRKQTLKFYRHTHEVAIPNTQQVIRKHFCLSRDMQIKDCLNAEECSKANYCGGIVIITNKSVYRLDCCGRIEENTIKDEENKVLSACDLTVHELFDTVEQHMNNQIDEHYQNVVGISSPIYDFINLIQVVQVLAKTNDFTTVELNHGIRGKIYQGAILNK